MPQTLRTKKDNLPDNPYELFDSWFQEASEHEIADPNAMALATANKDGIPSVRTVLMKGLDERGFVFYTNAESNKGNDLLENPNAALCFYWKSIRRQIRIVGNVDLVSDEEADAYYDSRHWSSRVGAWASKQSRPLGSYEELQELVANFEDKFKDMDSIPRPEHWKGFRIHPKTFEFWTEGEYRLHKRYLYTLDESGWTLQMLYP